ncbi:MAG: hypothetical protein BJ554DRAFT_4124 [Olpidium bornovanus]|uniref:poly(A)-specific ribonuclease n=1 Tax=Olpidium bornovanus TaxID=278681 RepID=A0A8H7ZN67_9FUNG|nr:MAG: hypothetical protein BJ554DRAFT_4124 [Olpidium bornovanus]
MAPIPQAYQNGLQRYPLYLKQALPAHLSALHGQVPATSQSLAAGDEGIVLWVGGGRSAERVVLLLVKRGKSWKRCRHRGWDTRSPGGGGSRARGGLQKNGPHGGPAARLPTAETIPPLQSSTAGPAPAMTIAAPGKYHEEQLKAAANSRNSSGPHSHARAAAFQARQNPLVATLSESSVLSSVNSLLMSSMDKRVAAAATPTTASAENTPSQKWSALDMGGMGLKNVSPALFRYTFLTTLYLNHNNLSQLPPEFSLLRNVTTLDVSGNKLTCLPPELGMLTKLKELLLCDNSITTIPFELGTLYQLQTIALEGNPLNEGFKSMLQKDGTQALIAYLREHMPGRRRLRYFRARISARRLISIRDTLWAIYGQHALACRGLRRRLGASADCGAIEAAQYDELFRVQLSQADYDSVFWPKSRAKTMTEWERRTVDGCATFFKATKFKLIDKHLVEFSQLALQREDFRKTEDVFNRMMNKDNIAVLALLENRETRTRLLVANAHIHWDPHYRDVKLVQVAMLMEELHKWAAKCIKAPPAGRSSPSTAATSAAAKASEGPPQPAACTTPEKLPMVICGDFNSLVNSGVYQFLSRGSVQHGHDDFGKHAYGNFTSEGLSHPFSLKSAYMGEHELPFTNHTPTFSDVIDYIWYSSNTLTPTGLLGPIDKAYMSGVVGLPNFHFPSE